MASIYRRGRKWWGRVQREGKDLRQSLETTSKEVARKRLSEWLDRLESVAWGDKPRHTFDEAMEKFVSEHLPAMKPRAAKRYGDSIAQLLIDFEGKYLDEIGSAELSEFEARRRREGVTRKRGKRTVVTPIAPGSIRRDLACLSSMFGDAIDWEWVETNPVAAYLRRRRKRGALKEAAPRTRYLTHEEERALLAEASPEVRRAIEFAIDTGLRMEEQFALERPQVSATRVKVIARTSKNSRDREVPLLERSARISAQNVVPFRSPYLFTNAETETRYRNLDKGFRAAARRAGLKDVRWHDLRRTCGCRLLQDRGFSLEQVKEWLGHSSVKVTEKAYAFLRVEDLEKKLQPPAQKPAHKVAHDRRKPAGSRGGRR